MRTSIRTQKLKKKKRNIQACWHVLAIPVLGISTQMDPRSSLASPPSLLGVLKASEGPCLNKQGS